MIKTKKFFAAACALALSAALSGTAMASAMLVDRGLPTDNLNNDAGADRSNVSWTFTQYAPTDYWIVGDTFTNNSTQAWAISSITLWTVGQTDTAILLGGISGSTPGVVSNAAYIGGATYQGSSGGRFELHQVDFAVNILLAAGETFEFFFDGSGAEDTAKGTFVPYLHASNAAKSGSPQESADNLMLAANVRDGGIVTSSIESWTSLGNGWDKASDINVQVFGNAVPEPTSIALVGLALIGAAGASRRKKA